MESKTPINNGENSDDNKGSEFGSCQDHYSSDGNSLASKAHEHIEQRKVIEESVKQICEKGKIQNFLKALLNNEIEMDEDIQNEYMTAIRKFVDKKEFIKLV